MAKITFEKDGSKNVVENCVAALMVWGGEKDLKTTYMTDGDLSPINLILGFLDTLKSISHDNNAYYLENLMLADSIMKSNVKCVFGSALLLDEYNNDEDAREALEFISKAFE